MTPTKRGTSPFLGVCLGGPLIRSATQGGFYGPQDAVYPETWKDGPCGWSSPRIADPLSFARAAPSRGHKFLTVGLENMDGDPRERSPGSSPRDGPLDCGPRRDRETVHRPKRLVPNLWVKKERGRSPPPQKEPLGLVQRQRSVRFTIIQR